MRFRKPRNQKIRVLLFMLSPNCTEWLLSSSVSSSVKQELLTLFHMGYCKDYMTGTKVTSVVIQKNSVPVLLYQTWGSSKTASQLSLRSNLTSQQHLALAPWSTSPTPPGTPLLWFPHVPGSFPSLCFPSSSPQPFNVGTLWDLVLSPLLSRLFY